MPFEPILDECSLVPCSVHAIPHRLATLGRLLQSFDAVGLPRVLRSVDGASARDIGDGRGLGAWCFDRRTDRDIGRFVASRLSKQPYLDGERGLWAAQEEGRLLETRVGDQRVVGLGYAAHTASPAVQLLGENSEAGGAMQVTVDEFTDGELVSFVVVAQCFVHTSEVESARRHLEAALHNDLADGNELVQRLPELFANLRLGIDAVEQLQELDCRSECWPHVLRHLRELQDAALKWQVGRPFEPNVSWSYESDATLTHAQLQQQFQLRDETGNRMQFSAHTKSANLRIYFHHDSQLNTVTIGRVGPHLRTAKFR